LFNISFLSYKKNSGLQDAYRSYVEAVHLIVQHGELRMSLRSAVCYTRWMLIRTYLCTHTYTHTHTHARARARAHVRTHIKRLWERRLMRWNMYFLN